MNRAQNNFTDRPIKRRQSNFIYVNIRQLRNVLKLVIVFLTLFISSSQLVSLDIGSE